MFRSIKTSFGIGSAFAALLTGTSILASSSTLECEDMVSSSRLGLVHRVIEMNLLSTDELRALHQGLLDGTWAFLPFWKSPDGLSKTLHFHALRRALEASPEARADVMTALVNHLDHQSQVAQVRIEVQTKAQSTVGKVTFVNVMPRPFRRWRKNIDGKGMEWEWKKSSRGFFISSTPATQYHYFRVMGHLPRGLGTIPEYAMPIEGTMVMPDHAIEMLRFYEAAEFVFRLNLLADSRSPVLGDLFDDHREGDFYDLPTSEMWDQVVSQVDGLDLNREGFYRARSADDAVTHRGDERLAIFERPPLSLNGRPIYDLIGPYPIWTRSVVGRGIPDARMFEPFAYSEVVTRGLNSKYLGGPWRIADTYSRTQIWSEGAGIRIVRLRGLNRFQKLWARQRLESLRQPHSAQ